MDDFIIEQVAVEDRPSGRKANPITLTMRKLKIGESFVVPFGHRSWTGCQVRNENLNKEKHFVAVRLENGWRIGRTR